jgi:hypothetical protein
MKILLVNVDSRFNIAIRRMYSYFTAKGEDVELLELGFSAYPHKRTKVIDGSPYDEVYVSNIFDINQGRVIIENCDHVLTGGIGSEHPERKLTDEMEAADPFYFPHEEVSYGFISRGCIRNCWFCKVPKYEGRMKVYNTIEKVVYSNPNMKRVSFMDNNILALPDHNDIFQWLIDRKILCDFNQGLDFRLVNEENIQLLKQLRYYKNYIFAFDDPKYEPVLNKKIKLIQQHIDEAWRLKFYIYYHPAMDINLAIRRVEWCRNHQCLPYLMRDSQCWECEDKDFLTDYAAYCNQPGFFKNFTFEEFMLRRENSSTRISTSIKKYNLYAAQATKEGLNVWNGKTKRY